MIPAPRATEVDLPKAENGLTLPLSRSLGSRALAEHRALVALELEVIAKKQDRYGWDRDRNSPAHDRLVIDWMDALQDYPISEIRTACREVVQARPNLMPNEGHIVARIQQNRAEFLRRNPKPQAPETQRERLTAERASEIMNEVGFRPKRFQEG